jgi:hypothetical protein
MLVALTGKRQLSIVRRRAWHSPGVKDSPFELPASCSRQYCYWATSHAKTQISLVKFLHLPQTQLKSSSARQTTVFNYGSMQAMINFVRFPTASSVEGIVPTSRKQVLCGLETSLQTFWVLHQCPAFCCSSASPRIRSEVWVLRASSHSVPSQASEGQCASRHAHLTGSSSG